MSGYVEAATAVVNTVGGAVKILEASRPSVDSNQLLASAMPNGADPMNTPAQGRNTIAKWYLQGWSFAGERYSSQCKVHISWAWGARFNGGGAFIPSVWAWVDQVDVPEMWVPWSHDLDITFDPGNPYSQQAGDGEIYACLPLTVRCEENTPVGMAQQTWQFIIYGTGHHERQ